MNLADSQKNMNIRIPTLLLNRIRVVALQKHVYAKDLVIQYLKEGIDKEEKTVLEAIRFEGHVLEGPVMSLDLLQLSHERLVVDAASAKEFIFCDHEVQPERCVSVENCDSFKKLVGHNGKELSRFYSVAKSHFIYSCYGLDILQKAKPSKHSRFQTLPSSLKDMEKYPSSLINFFDDVASSHSTCDGTEYFSECAEQIGRAHV